MILYPKSNLVYTVVFPQFLLFQQNNSAQTSMLIFFTSRHYYFFEKSKIVEKQLRKLNCSYGKVSHTLKAMNHKSHVTCPNFFLFFTTTHVHMKRDIDLKFWEIKLRYVCIVYNMYNYKTKKYFESFLTIQTHFSAFYLISQNLKSISLLVRKLLRNFFRNLVT